MNIQAPSARMKPSRSALKGREDSAGLSQRRVEMTRIFSKAERMPGEMGASAPPASIMGMEPERMREAA